MVLSSFSSPETNQFSKGSITFKAKAFTMIISYLLGFVIIIELFFELKNCIPTNPTSLFLVVISIVVWDVLVFLGTILILTSLPSMINWALGF